MADNKSGRKKVALLLVGMVLGAALITPAGAHVTSVRHSWKKHFLPLAKKAFYTKKQSNARFANAVPGTDKAKNADKLDGMDSSAFASSTYHNWAYMDECDAASTWNECGAVQIVVPAGESYNVSVWNSVTAEGPASDVTATFCAARRNVGTETTPTCITPFGAASGVTILAGKRTAWASSGETTLGAGTWKLSLGFNPTAEVAFDSPGKVVTKILVRDASVPAPASTLKITATKPASRG